jgi:hypothetical protein
MTQYQKIRTKPKQFKALCSITIEQFDILLPIFEGKWLDFIEGYTLDGQPRVRKYTPKNEEQLPTAADKLFFILYYDKNNPLQESLAAFFDLEVSMSNKWVHILTPILKKALAQYTPCRRIETLEINPQEEHIVDGSERPIQRDTYLQGDFYSGKKGTHTVKDVLLVTSIGLILWLGATSAGKLHDKTLVEDLTFHTSFTLLADLGFLGWQPNEVNLILPHKKARNTNTQKRDLTQEQKDFNKGLAKRRVKVENVLAHVKILRIVKDRNRNYKLNFRDDIMVIACAIHNFRLKKPSDCT